MPRLRCAPPVDPRSSTFILQLPRLVSGLFSSLNTTVKALNAHGRALETAGKNLANVNNVAYARQRVTYGDRGTVVTPTGAESLGLEALGVEQLRDALVDRQLMREISLKSSFTAEQAGYQRAQAGLGQSITATGATDATSASANGLGAALDRLFSSFQGLAASPTDVGARQLLLQNAAILTDRFRLADTRLDQVQSDLDAQIASDVSTANTLLTTIASLNGQIGRFETNAPGSAVDLRDQRQAKLEELAAKLPVEVRDAGGGQFQVFAKDGAGADVILVDLANVQGTVAFDGTQITAGATATPLGLASGAVKGSLTARDGAVQSLRSNLDLLARQLVTAVNTAYNPTGATGDFFQAAGTTAASIRLESSVTTTSLKASDGGAAGDNTVALAVAALATRQFSTAGAPPDVIDGTLGNFYGNAVSDIGQALAGANSRVEDQDNIERLVRSQRDSVSGISLDEELADLLKYQRAFQASSRVFGVVDELLDLVVNRLGRG
jgi:flagellar hook-associated protein 1 FlgK